MTPPATFHRLSAPPRRITALATRWCGLALCSLVLSGCAVIAVADVAASAVVGVAGLAVDAAVGTAKIGGKVIGKTADVVLGSDAAPAD
ncbi:MAG: hypothetical protein Q8S28_16580 [Hydrogenophaga sp.]|nr:hypothetical protein [Hydrogenophaga sp.]